MAAPLFFAPVVFLAGLAGDFEEAAAEDFVPELSPVAGAFFRLFTPAITPAAATAAAAATAIPTLDFEALVLLVLPVDFFAGDFFVALVAVAFAGVFLEPPFVAAMKRSPPVVRSLTRMPLRTLSPCRSRSEASWFYLDLNAQLRCTLRRLVERVNKDR
ncbi:MAG TPA: hypothetical protein VE685_07885 [Thermoanaerobaculia bacterium]|nr:hypothetical protein [Thermoanaerobaculia bacterium]